MKTNEIMQIFTKKELDYLGKRSISKWVDLIAKAARRAKGKTSFNTKSWLKANKKTSGYSKNVGLNLKGYCGAASWLYVSIKNLTAKRKYGLKYYEDKEHITVIRPDGKEIDITEKQHQGKKSYKKAKTIRMLKKSEFEREPGTMKRFERFAIDFKKELDTNLKK